MISCNWHSPQNQLNNVQNNRKCSQDMKTARLIQDKRQSTKSFAIPFG